MASYRETIEALKHERLRLATDLDSYRKRRKDTTETVYQQVLDVVIDDILALLDQNMQAIQLLQQNQWTPS